MQSRSLGQSRRCGQRGYTLIEVLIALIMFTFISLAAGFAMTGALHIQHGAKAKADELQEARTLLAIIARDLRATYASTSNPNTFFTAQSDGDNTSQIMFTTLGNRLVPSGVSGVPDPNAAPALPQSDVGIVAYTFDPASNSLYRAETAIPSADMLTQLTQSPSPDNLLSNHVISISFQFLDPNNPDPQNGWRTDWTYAQDPNQMTQASTGGQTGAGGASGAGAAASQGGASAQDNTSAQNSIGAMLASGGQQLDTTLPLTVQVSLVLVNPDGQSSTYTTAVTLPAFNPQPAGQTPDAATTATGGTPTTPGVPGQGGNGGGNGGSGNGGGPRPGGGGGGPRPAPTPGAGGTLPGLGGMGPRP